METSITRLKASLSELLDKIPEVYKEVLTAEEGVSLKQRLGAAQDLMDRLGLSAVKSVVSKNLTATVDGTDLLEAQKELLEQRTAVAGEIASLKAQLEEADAMPLEEAAAQEAGEA
jgi:hypothetical protein